MSSERRERLDAGAGDEDPDGPELGRGPAANAASTDARSATSTSMPDAPSRPPACSSAAAASAPGRCGRAGRPRARRRRAAGRRRARCPTPPPVTTATAAHRGASTGSNSRCRLGEAAEDPRRLVVEAAVAGRAVVLLGQADVARAVEDALEADPALGPGERAAGAGVGAAPEGDVGLRRWAGRCGTRAGTRSGAGRGWRRR